MDYEALLEELGLDTTPQKTKSKSPLHTRATDNTHTDSGKIKLILNVNLSANKVEQLMIYQDDDPKVKVSEFCHQHQLDKNAQNVLIKQINSQEQYTSAKSQSNYYSKKNYSTKESENPGERLYQLAQKKKKQREDLIEQYRTEQKLQDEKALQSTPKLSKNTKILLEQVGYKKNGYMKEKGTLKDKQLEQVFQDEQGKLYNFQPQINDLSKQMSHYIREKQHYENVFDELYEQARNRMYSQPEQDNPECTFQPMVNSNYTISEDFLTRMEKKQQEQKERMDRIRLKYENVDLKTRQMLYRPKICRSPNILSSEKPIHEKLYLQSKLKSNKLQLLLEQKEQEEKQQLNLKITNELSEDIVFLQRKKIIKSLFEQMDFDNDGFVECSYDEVNILSPNIVQILWPVFKKIQDKGWKLDSNDFFELIYDFCLTLSQSQKEILFMKRVVKHQEQLSFTPQTNKKSKTIHNNYMGCKCETCLQIKQIQKRLQSD